ncbi:MAG TPA: carboxypeptidase-like regulatory domain-containing protein [Bryobacteraceae bacterium]|nr:carboxypeptidase-like regulatory domain-containing protein [Bryobacteraceae bacterium]
MVGFILATLSCAIAFGGSLTGTVKDDVSGQPLVNAKVAIFAATGSAIAESLTDGNGRFSTSDLPNREYRFVVSKTYYRSVEGHISADEGTAVLIRMLPYGTISGAVSGVSAGVVVAVPISAPLTARPASASWSASSTINEGHYKLVGLPPGRYVIGLWNPQLEEGGRLQGLFLYPDSAQPREFAVDGGEEYENINFLPIAPEAYAISGSVEGSDDYATISAVPVALPSFAVGAVMVQRDGSFRMARLAAGAYDILAISGGRASAPKYGKSRVLLDHNIDNLDIHLAPGRVVKVTLNRNGPLTHPWKCDGPVELAMVSSERWPTSSDRVIGGVNIAATVDHLAPRSLTA